MTGSHVCVDASFIVRLLLSAEEDEPAPAMWRSFVEVGVRAIAPGLLWYEVTNALHRYAVHGVLTPEEASRSLHSGIELGVVCLDGPTLHSEALRLAGVLGQGAAYDAHYVALASSRSTALCTGDAKLARSLASVLPDLNVVVVGS